MCKLIYLTIFLLLYNFEFIFGDKVAISELVNDWKLKNENSSIKITELKLPSGVFTVLKNYYGDILNSKNDINLRWIANENWTYELDFSVDASQPTDRVNLTLHGIDTVATIRLNNEDIGTTDNMFVRYSYDVTLKLKESNKLEVIIMSPIKAAQQRADALIAKNITQPPNCPEEYKNCECHRNMLRKMQMSFGGDFNLAAPSMGIWKVVTLERYEVAIMRDVDVALQRNDTHWTMDVRIFLTTSTQNNFYGELFFYAGDLLEKPLNVSRRLISFNEPIAFKVSIPKEKVKLWWPNGYGNQKLYPLLFSMNCWENEDGPRIASKTVSQKRLNIGFRTIELVENLDEYGRSFYFKVNGHPIFMKGANYLTAHILPENLSQLQDRQRIRHLLESAKKANMNMIRVWGGGLYESDYFYSLADYYGLLIWQDMTFYAATYPVNDEFVESVRLETVQNAKRIAYHPSLALIVTNDEIELFLTKNRSSLGLDAERFEKDYKQLFVGTIKHELKSISRKDFNPRPGPMMSTPSKGIEDITKLLPLDPQNPNFGDVHLWEDNKNIFDPQTYPMARFISEYGIQSLPIIASWNRALGENDTIADLIKHRQHNKNSFNSMVKLVNDWENNIDSLIYLSQVNQAVSAKLATDIFRSQRMNKRTMGALYWHLNDVWVAPTGSIIDFYGNYKLLYYWQREFLKSIAVIALYDAKNRMVNVTLTREDVTDYRDAKIYYVDVNTYLWSELFPKKQISWAAVLDSNNITQQYLEYDKLLENGQNENNSFMEFILREDSNILSTTFMFPVVFADIIGLKDPQLTFVISKSYCNNDVSNDMRINSYSLSIIVTRPALFVYIEVNHAMIDKYRLSQNGFVMVEPIKTVHLEFEHKTQCVILTTDHIKIQTMNKFKQQADNPITTVTTPTSTSPTTPSASPTTPSTSPTTPSTTSTTTTITTPDPTTSATSSTTTTTTDTTMDTTTEDSTTIDESTVDTTFDTTIDTTEDTTTDDTTIIDSTTEDSTTEDPTTLDTTVDTPPIDETTTTIYTTVPTSIDSTTSQSPTTKAAVTTDIPTEIAA